MRRPLATLLMGLAVSAWGIVGCESSQPEYEPAQTQQQYTQPQQQPQQQQQQQSPEGETAEPIEPTPAR